MGVAVASHQEVCVCVCVPFGWPLLRKRGFVKKGESEICQRLGAESCRYGGGRGGGCYRRCSREYHLEQVQESFALCWGASR